MQRRNLLLAILAVAFAPAGWSFMRHARATDQPRWFTGLVDGVAVGGYDPVAYFTQGAPMKGDPAIAAEHDGAKWYFASDANRATFLADPTRYAPQYGGYCAYAISQGYTAKGEPEVWDIVDGKLFLNYDKSVQTTWKKDVPGYVASANENWPTISR